MSGNVLWKDAEGKILKELFEMESNEGWNHTDIQKMFLRFPDVTVINVVFIAGIVYLYLTLEIRATLIE